MTEQLAQARVAYGAAYLDGVCPGWATRIDLGTLRMETGTQCVIGQLGHGEGWNAVSPLLVSDTQFAVDCGVFCDDMNGNRRDNYRLLQDAWVAAIAARLVPKVEQPALVEASE